MREDMISNALIYLSSRLCNYIAAGEGFNPVPAGDRSEVTQEDEPGEFGKSQKSLLHRWTTIWHEFDVWFNSLPSTFKPSARIKSTAQRPLKDVQIFPPSKHRDLPFDQIWFSLPLCAATMMQYHMGRILLLINKPHETTARRTTVGTRLKSYRDIDEDIVCHCYEIWYVKKKLYINAYLFTDFVLQWYRIIPPPTRSAHSHDPTVIRSRSVSHPSSRTTRNCRSFTRCGERPGLGDAVSCAAVGEGMGLGWGSGGR